MTPLLFAQALAEYGSIEGLTASLRLMWDTVWYRFLDLDQTTWAIIGSGVLLALLLWGRRRGGIR